MAKEYQFNWRPTVPAVLQQGSVFDRYDDESTCLELNAHVRIDEYGFFLYWMIEGRDAVVLDMGQVWEARPAGLPKEGRILLELEQRGVREAIEDRTVWITHGQDLVNVQSFYLVAETIEIAKVWRLGINEILKNSKIRHVCPTTNLLKYWKWLTLNVNDRRKIPIKLLIKTFSSGKPEKMVHKCLSDLGLGGDKYTVPRARNRSMGKKVSSIYKCSNSRRRKATYSYNCLQNKFLITGKMSGDAFLRFLMSDENSPVFLDRIDMYQDMDQPLCHYYINRMFYIKFEIRPLLDLIFLSKWPNIAWKSSEICCCQNHSMIFQCVPNLSYVSNILYHSSIRNFQLEPGTPLPSPNRLKRKILIKNKRLKAEIEKHQLEQFLREGKLDEEDEMAETPEVVGEDLVISVPILRQNRHAQLVLLLNLRPHVNENLVGESQPSKEVDEAHPELKQNFISKNLKSLGFSKKQELDVFERGGADKRSFRRTAKEDHSDSAALLDLPRTSSSRGKKKAQVRLRGHDIFSDPILYVKKLKYLLPILTKEEEERIFAEYHYTGATTNIHPLLSSLINYTHPVKFSGFDVAENNNLHFHMSSFSESTGLGYLKQCAPEFVNYNKRQLSRIYPKGARVDSSNFLPQIFWNAGCQMVSLNFQTPDVYMQLNMGKFEYNAGSGYLLKPDFMRRPDRTFDPFSESPVDGVIAAHCSVRVIAGQFLSDRKVGTYVEVEMYGLPTDTIRKEHRTRIVQANGLNPVYNEDPFVFRKVVLPELAVLRFAVCDENGKQLGQRILPLDGLQAGYRHISLRSDTNQVFFLMFSLIDYLHLFLLEFCLVDALADPRAYLSEQKKRQEALAHMGVDDSDIVEVSSTAWFLLLFNCRKDILGYISFNYFNCFILSFHSLLDTFHNVNRSVKVFLLYFCSNSLDLYLIFKETSCRSPESSNARPKTSTRRRNERVEAGTNQKKHGRCQDSAHEERRRLAKK
uniref:Phosphoinositide phospholipase C n=1 Tax=Heterorhabditis bacteriophora TaxID=37862 RepID=A0A1I7WQ88_HETBA